MTLSEHPFVKHVTVSSARKQAIGVSILSDTTHPIEIKKEVVAALKAQGYSIKPHTEHDKTVAINAGNVEVGTLSRHVNGFTLILNWPHAIPLVKLLFTSGPQRELK